MHGYSIPQIRRLVLEILDKHNVKAQRLLDIGGATGDFTRELGEIVGATHVYIIDIDKDALEKAKKRGFMVYRIDVSRESLPFQDSYFDLVTMIEVIEHLIDPDHCISEVRRVLRSKGFLMITTPNLAWWVNRLAILLGYQPYFSEPSTRINVGKAFRKTSPYQASGHIRLFTLRALIDYLKYYNFVIIDIRGSPGHHNSKLITFIDNIFSRRPSFSADIAILARKN